MDYSDYFSVATYAYENHRQYLILDRRDNFVGEGNGEDICIEAFNDACQDGAYPELSEFSPLTVKPEDWERTFGPFQSEWMQEQYARHQQEDISAPFDDFVVIKTCYYRADHDLHTAVFDRFTVRAPIFPHAYWIRLDSDAQAAIRSCSNGAAQDPDFASPAQKLIFDYYHSGDEECQNCFRRVEYDFVCNTWSVLR